MKELRQKDMDIKDYLFKTLSMRKRMDLDLNPFIKQVAKCLTPQCHDAMVINTKKCGESRRF